MQAVVHWYGPTDLVSEFSLSWLEDIITMPLWRHLSLRRHRYSRSLTRLLRPAPMRRVSAMATPFLSHARRVVPFNETESLHTALCREGTNSTSIPIAGVEPEDLFDSPANLAITAAFFGSHLIETVRP